MKMDKEKVIDIISMLGYFVLAYFSIELFSINKYDWMMDVGDTVCSIPHQSLSNRTLQASIAAFFLVTPLLIALLRNIYIRNRYKTWLYTSGILGVTIYGGWMFFGRFIWC
ncbi:MULTISPECIES: DUF2645 family protein [unclassified Serratia (in: enterobacteria)]|uniref:DUF2645 family protein n=1 Tax=unclassified Serratia (in: enterobacteria) TaxID=2647522 RepID=UPI00068D22D9|nr:MULTISPECIES: DUF2645 family protein [unclassified Serratia (in: enterobacteria)]